MNAKLIKAVTLKLGGKESASEVWEDIVNHGADSGFCGFTYYTDTVAFFKRNRKEIMELAKEMAQEFGYNVIELVASFGCLKQYDKNELHDDIANTLYNPSKPNTIVANAMAWFALEEVARYKVDQKELQD